MQSVSERARSIHSVNTNISKTILSSSEDTDSTGNNNNKGSLSLHTKKNSFQSIRLSNDNLGDLLLQKD